ncbi:MAG: type II toxin-antitoxin system RelE/ParE family toxin [Pseudomonadota bacterium]|uniref:type II toxin-antitoxin system RelE/ParE family toxin n=1 Tax=Polaromonas sp. TaxID=1869339 RepID=UPI0017B78A59|nr:type II toxin-antitoxin system RelE/ParE family toxin [Polaromonas sp.]MBA3592607.1 type II toxin-antitoxin system RelE/ParE family toxin [Polaromonas sp.]MDQ3273238.1 type II toxin-antitoxin system RelE/ParE family toxin [Pseudomonadota bacterium]
MKTISWVGDSKKDLLGFPVDVRREAGYQLGKVQAGLEPDDWKPMKTVGSGVREIRIRDASGAFRVIYLANVGTTVYVLHCFQKKTEKTSLPDLRLAQERFKRIQE